MSSVEQEIVAAAREVAALFVEHPFVPRTWAEVRRFVAAVAQMTTAGPAEADPSLASPRPMARDATADRGSPSA